MKNNAIELIEWLQTDVLKDKISSHLPTILLEHCVGADKALGAAFPAVFLHGNEIQNIEMDISQLVAAARSYIVFDDILRDHDMPELDRNIIHNALISAEKSCIYTSNNLLHSLSSARHIVDSRIRQLKMTYSHLHDSRIKAETKIFGRCALLGLPFDVLSEMGVWNKHEARRRLRCARMMLFTLQIADDLADLYEDQKNPECYNLLLERIPDKNIQQVENRVIEAYTYLGIIGSARMIIHNAKGIPKLIALGTGILKQFIIHNETVSRRAIIRVFNNNPPCNYGTSKTVSSLMEREISSLSYIADAGTTLRAEFLHTRSTSYALSVKTF